MNNSSILTPLLLFIIFCCGQPYNNKFIYNIRIYYYISAISITGYLHTGALGEWTVVSVTILLGDTDITLLYNKSVTQICILSFTDLEEVSGFMISSGIKQQWDDRPMIIDVWVESNHQCWEPRSVDSMYESMTSLPSANY